ncbi:LuxR C-terminal-related transcriptional regulator [Kitasatospora sp. NPDC058965]|uniref:helix-turn-helix transcriptional regulator n=1 Tax=Kitasatospora sp. NPDC058965 TaxID=3346682 RepID=UPI0036C8B5A7
MSAPADLVHRTLTALGPSTQAELAATLKMARRRVQEALDELRAVGGCEPEGARQPRWRAAAAHTLADALRRRRLETAAAANTLRQRMTSPGGLAIKEADLSTAFGTTIRPLFGSEQVRARLGDLVAAEHCEHLAMNPEPAFDNRTLQAAAPLDRKLVSRGIQLFSLGVPRAADDRSGAHTQELIAGGMHYRELPALPTKLIIIDRTTAIVPIDPGTPGKGAWEITTPAVLHRLTELYLQYWHQGITPERRWTPPMSLTPRERAVLSLLADGHTDDSAAAQLGLSRRTIAYTIADLMERYNARNRFQLGLFLSDLDTPATDNDPAPADHEPEDTEHS